MNLDSLNKWLTLVANIGVLAGLIAGRSLEAAVDAVLDAAERVAGCFAAGVLVVGEPEEGQ